MGRTRTPLPMHSKSFAGCSAALIGASDDYEYLRGRQAQLLRSDIAIRPAPRSGRARNVQPLSAEQIEASILRALRESFRGDGFPFAFSACCG